eukprot:TRINITY_DN15523_c0_g1_i1.p1 TRINITY_DN15523_c0_g1~~TRINITY_DN15523_c0_g1_i1.p1  ORF type:complete len:493 (+),score=121.48 TRINITY_DN15523_c0_g1_i1:169-1647(+)
MCIRDRAELAEHNTKDDCWVLINDKVYNLTPFLEEHPGGSKVITKYAGRNGSKAFNPIHPPDIVSKLGFDHLCVGSIDVATIPAEEHPDEVKVATVARPPLGGCLNVFDFEAIAQHCLTPEAWAYYSSGGDDEITMRDNMLAFQRIWLRPRVLVNVKTIDMFSTMLNQPTSIPLYITATALAKLAHPDGEVALVRAAHDSQVPYMLPTLASCSLDQMLHARRDNQPNFFQLYVNENRELTQKLIRQAEKGGCSGLFVTVDAPQLGRREKDMRIKMTLESSSVQKVDDSDGKVDRSQGTARAISQFIDPSLCWDDIPWFKSVTRMPVILKGVQTAEDALLAVRAGVDGIVLSNHGGRQLDTSRSGIEILVEVMAALRDAGVADRIDVFVDGGVRRGTDIFKALALGAKAVGIGRPTLYGLGAYGEEGVCKVISLLKDELEMCMRLMGTPTVADINPSLVSTASVSSHMNTAPLSSHLPMNNYQPMPSINVSKL